MEGRHIFRGPLAVNCCFGVCHRLPVCEVVPGCPRKTSPGSPYPYRCHRYRTCRLERCHPPIIFLYLIVSWTCHGTLDEIWVGNGCISPFPLSARPRCFLRVLRRFHFIHIYAPQLKRHNIVVPGTLGRFPCSP